MNKLVDHSDTLSLLTLDHVDKSFKSAFNQTVKAVDDFSLSIQKGELLTLLGPSGCGKTTVLRILAGFESIDSGNIILSGESITHIPAFSRNMPMIFQSYALFPHLTIFENIAYGLKIRKIKAQIIKNDVEMVLHVVNLAGLEQRYPRELSGGQQQRAALARALVLKPEIILLDEPLSNLDMKLRTHTRAEIKRIQQTLGITAIYVTHDQEEAISIADRIVIMDKGKIVQIGSPEDIYNTPSTIFVADFIGNTNFIEAEILKLTDDVAIVSVLDQQIAIQYPRDKTSFTHNEEVYLTIKPEAVRINQDHSVEAGFKGKISKASFLGPNVEYEIEFGNSFITATQPNSNPRLTILPEGTEVNVELDENCLRLLKKD
ncbi:MAG: ABC transporter ATP-binding protein [Arenicella sp.]